MAALRKTRKFEGKFGIGAYGTVVAVLLLVSAAPAAVAQTSGTFTQTGFMKLARQAETATLLPNGQVLVTGGSFYSCAEPVLSTPYVTSTAEIFDPAVGTFAYTGKMTIPRFGHTATLLQNREVLIVGGRDSNGQVRGRAEIYDPGTGKFTRTGNMILARVGHTATLLPSGKVLVAGGMYYGSTGGIFYLTDTAELYDPATGTFALTGNLTAPLDNPVANLLNGEVLIAGGWTTTGSTYVNAQLYDASTGSFTAVTQTGGGGHGYGVSSSTLGDGRVVIAGGAADLYQPDDNYTNHGDQYDPVSGKIEGPYIFATGGPNPLYAIGRGLQTTTLLSDEYILMAGGYGWNGEQGPVGPLASAELFNPYTNSFATTGSMLITRVDHAAVKLNDGRVLVAGGCDGSNTRGEAELYTP